MPSRCLQIIADPDHEETFRWVVLEQEAFDAHVFKHHSTSECDFDSWRLRDRPTKTKQLTQ
jgi:hypothetical protein